MKKGAKPGQQIQNELIFQKIFNVGIFMHHNGEKNTPIGCPIIVRPQFMHTFTFSGTRNFLTLITVMFVFSAFSTINAYAQDVSVEIARQQEMIEKLEDQFMASQRRILSSDSSYVGQELPYDQLNTVGNLLASTNREFTVLIQSLILASLVTDPHAIPQARKIFGLQKQYMVKRMTNASDFIEKSMHRIKDQETNRMLLEARDLFRSSAELVNRVQISVPKHK